MEQRKNSFRNQSLAKSSIETESQKFINLDKSNEVLNSGLRKLNTQREKSQERISIKQIQISKLQDEAQPQSTARQSEVQPSRLSDFDASRSFISGRRPTAMLSHELSQIRRVKKFGKILQLHNQTQISQGRPQDISHIDILQKKMTDLERLELMLSLITNKQGDMLDEEKPKKQPPSFQFYGGFEKSSLLRVGDFRQQYYENALLYLLKMQIKFNLVSSLNIFKGLMAKSSKDTTQDAITPKTSLKEQRVHLLKKCLKILSKKEGHAQILSRLKTIAKQQSLSPKGESHTQPQTQLKESKSASNFLGRIFCLRPKSVNKVSLGESKLSRVRSEDWRSPGIVSQVSRPFDTQQSAVPKAEPNLDTRSPSPQQSQKNLSKIQVIINEAKLNDELRVQQLQLKQLLNLRAKGIILEHVGVKKDERVLQRMEQNKLHHQSASLEHELSVAQERRGILNLVKMEQIDYDLEQLRPETIGDFEQRVKDVTSNRVSDVHSQLPSPPLELQLQKSHKSIATRTTLQQNSSPGTRPDLTLEKTNSSSPGPAGAKKIPQSFINQQIYQKAEEEFQQIQKLSQDKKLQKRKETYLAQIKHQELFFTPKLVNIGQMRLLRSHQKVPSSGVAHRKQFNVMDEIKEEQENSRRKLTGLTATLEMSLSKSQLNLQR